MAELVLVRPGLSNPIEAHWSLTPHLGLAYLASAARSQGITVAVVDGKLERHTDHARTASQIIAARPLYVGLTAMTMEYPKAIEIARQVKRQDPRLILILGGPHANALPEKSLLESDSFDYVMVGEAEFSLPALITALREGRETHGIPGLFSRNDWGEVVRSSPPEVVNVNTLPFPAWDIFPKTSTYPIIAARGCPYRCVFCSHNLGYVPRFRSVEDVIREIEWLQMRFRPRTLCFTDETFGLSLERALTLLAWLAKFNRHHRMRFTAQTRADHISEELAISMKKAGFEYVDIGAESGDRDVLAKSGKGIRLDHIEDAVRIIKRAGLKSAVNFIIGLPGETRASVSNTIKFARRLNPDCIAVALIVAYPGSKIYGWAERGEHGYRLLTREWEKWDKYLGASIELASMNYGTMRRLQIEMYLQTYLRNLRLGELLRLVRASWWLMLPSRLLARQASQGDRTNP